MLGDAELQALDGHLGAIVREDQQHHENLQNLLQQFQDLLESYSRLKSDYEEEKENREKYKKLARGQERNPFALVLVDGDGYLFKENLLKAGSEGGVAAARLLSDSIKELLQDQLGSQAGQCRIMVRVYSNVLGLSKTLARSGLVGNEARSFSPFASSFTRSQDLFDFVDAGDKKEGADYKIREMFRLFADNNQCKHIFFAGCHDTGYLSLLTPYRGRNDRITLLKAGGFHSEFNKLDLPVRELPAVFMSTPVGTSQVPAPPRPICRHFQKGICRYGNECTKLHIMPNQQRSKNADYTPPQSSPSHITVRQQDYYALRLPPRFARKTEEFIPINKDGERLDTYMPMPSRADWDEYTRRSRQHKICNKYHLGGGCDNPNCEFDHSFVDEYSLDVMKYILRQHVCPRGLGCRSLKCYLGHICQKDGCRATKSCKFSRHAHTLDIEVAQWVAPTAPSEGDDSPTSDKSLDLNMIDPHNTLEYLMKDISF